MNVKKMINDKIKMFLKSLNHHSHQLRRHYPHHDDDDATMKPSLKLKILI